MSELLKNLNEAQRAAVVNYESPSLIVAGAGSGKTRVLTSRIAYMLEQGILPWRILALTFTNKAASEMRERIGQMVSPEQSNRLWMGTFHSIFLKILRMEADKLGYPSSFTIYDTSDSRNLIKTIVKEMNLPDDHYKPNAIQSRISLAKNNLVTPAAYEANPSYTAEDRQHKIPDFIEVYKAYMRRCKDNAAMDFDDMLLNINILFRDFPDVLAKYQERFQYILVDEYQDTNYAQYVIIRRLADKHHKVCVVGDDAQSIYSFRGAKIENILKFRNDFPQAQVFKLEQNYRSTQNIVGAANSIIEKNKNRLDKASFSKGDKGALIKVMKAYTDQEEASLVADEVRSLARGGAKWSEIALLYRTNMQSRGFEEAFRRRGIPYRIYGGMSFYQRKEVKDMMAYMQLIVNPNDDVAFRRIVNYPTRGIGDTTVGRLAQAALSKGQSIWNFVTTGDLKEAGLNGGAERKVKDFVALIESLSQERATMTLYEFGLNVATKSGIIGSYKIENTPEAQSALQNIEELLNSMQLFSEQQQAEMQFDPATGEPLEGVKVEPSVTEWLQSVALLTDMDEQEEDREKVTLMTIHSAKGLEFKYVFIVGLEENLFPSMMSMDAADGLEEERRLFYVALTRAMEKAYLSFSEMRFKWGSMEFCSPSRFLSEIDPKYLDMAFDLSEAGDRDRPAETIRKNYGDHNERARESYDRPGGRGQYRPAGEQRPPWERRSEPSKQMPRYEAPRPVEGPGSRFKSMGTRVAKPENEVATVSHAVADSGEFKVGQRVMHSKFGIGTISHIEHFGGDRKITVLFDDQAAGKKTLLSKYAKLAIVG